MITGGCNFNGVCRKVDIWDPATNTWSKARPMNSARRAHTLHVLPSGKVVALDRVISDVPPEIYDPESNRWEKLDLGAYIHPSLYMSTTLKDGRIMIVQAAGNLMTHDYLINAEEPSVTAITPRTNVTSMSLLMTLPDGRVLAMMVDGTCFLYDAAAATWTQTTNAPSAAAVVTGKACLPNGKALITRVGSSLIFDPKIEAWWTTLRIRPNVKHQGLSMCSDGTLVFTGGVRPSPNTRMGSLSVVVTGGWTPRRHLLWPEEDRRRVTAALLLMALKGVPVDLALMIITESSFAS